MCIQLEQIEELAEPMKVFPLMGVHIFKRTLPYPFALVLNSPETQEDTEVG